MLAYAINFILVMPLYAFFYIYINAIE